MQMEQAVLRNTIKMMLKLQLVKFDFLGLRNLTVIEDAFKILINDHVKEPLALNVPLMTKMLI
jgi:DNA polymerase III alpha subunit